jgi:transcriptional regulator with XRE-family HTH domain
MLAAVIGWSAGTVVRKLRGESPLTVDELYTAAGYLGLDPAELLPDRGLRPLDPALAAALAPAAR